MDEQTTVPSASQNQGYVTDALSATEAKELIRLCESGRLYEVEAWVKTGKSLKTPPEIRRTPLTVALSTGFHSLVEFLLRNEDRQQTKNDDLRWALQWDRPALVELAVGYGADTEAVPFLDVLMTGERGLASFFLERGADPLTDYPFARAFHQLKAKTTLGSYLDCRRSRPELVAQLQEQADMALRQFCQEGNLKWVSLLMWAGANPRSRGPALDDAEHADDPEWHTTGFEEACAFGNVELLKRLRPTRGDNLGGMLQRAAFSAHREVLEYLLDLGADPNDKPDGGSTALEASIRYLGWEDFDRVRYRYGSNYQTPAHKVPKGRGAIRLLVERGAKWTPEHSSLNDTRRILYKLEPDVTVELIGLLVERESGTDAARELLRVPRMRQHLRSCESKLVRLGLALEGRRRAQDTTRPAPSSYVLATYDRKQLYEEVWSEPTQRLAQKYGLSDVALSKVCAQLQVPKPPRGYWAKKQAGRPVPRRPKLKAFRCASDPCK